MILQNEKVLFVCETKAQLFNAINIKLNVYKGISADLCLCDNGNNNIGTLQQSVDTSEVFNNSYVYYTRHDTNQTLIAKVKRALRSTHLVRSVPEILPNKNNKYSMIFISGPSSSVNCVYYHFKKYNRNIKLYLYEEGIFEYYMFNNKNFARKLYSYVFYHRYYLDDAEGVYVYSPELLTGNVGNKKIMGIPRISFEDIAFVNAVNAAFDIEIESFSSIKNIKYLYMDQAFPSEEENIQQYQIIQKIAEVVGVDNILIKLHPNSPLDKYKEYTDICIKNNMAMEVIELNLRLRNVTLLTICSSSVFNFKLMFDANPRIFLLYQMFKSVTIGRNLFKFIEVFKNDYYNGEIFCPATMEEFENNI